MDYTDFEVGRLIDSLAASGELDNTLVMYVSYGCQTLFLVSNAARKNQEQSLTPFLLTKSDTVPTHLTPFLLIYRDHSQPLSSGALRF